MAKQTDNQKCYPTEEEKTTGVIPKMANDNNNNNNNRREREREPRFTLLEKYSNSKNVLSSTLRYCELVYVRIFFSLSLMSYQWN